jgi:hypothetical protein
MASTRNIPTNVAAAPAARVDARLLETTGTAKFAKSSLAERCLR